MSKLHVNDVDPQRHFPTAFTAIRDIVKNYHDRKPQNSKDAYSNGFVAFDFEFSGLNKDKSVMFLKDMEVKYKLLQEEVNRFCILEFGMAFFMPSSSQDFHVSAFNFRTFKQTDFEVSPSTLEFLGKSGFDFHQCFSAGFPLPYSAEKRSCGQSLQDVTSLPLEEKIKCIFGLICEVQLPIVLHNGLLDLLHLYRAFVGPLPSTLAKFASEIHSMFPAVYDTKFIAVQHSTENTTFLEYLHEKWSRKNERKNKAGLKFIYSVLEDAIAAQPVETEPTGICKQWAKYGFCNKRDCPYSHKIKTLLDYEENVGRKASQSDTTNSVLSAASFQFSNQFAEEAPKQLEKRSDIKKRKKLLKKSLKDDRKRMKTQLKVLKAELRDLKTHPSASSEAATAETDRRRNGAAAIERDWASAVAHNAGCDAVMTGRVFLFLVNGGEKTKQGVRESVNAIHLIGKKFPLLLKHSNFG
eukprot:GCRY01003946.1.p1 GENE.GCRY01003946.1~~GCRY01003946.1.p1  ORF type:complete len:467 (-),score=56.49 GCRY01003946.1:216-1616(-)